MVFAGTIRNSNSTQRLMVPNYKARSILMFIFKSESLNDTSTEFVIKGGSNQLLYLRSISGQW